MLSFAPPMRERTLEASVRDLSSERADVRASAVVDLARHAVRDAGARRRGLPLLERALRDNSERVRAAAATALADIAGHEALPSLLIAIEDVDIHVRQMALNAIGEIRDQRALPRLRRALRDERPEVRYQSLIAFCRVASSEEQADSNEINDALQAGLNDTDEAVRYIALRIAEERFEVDGIPVPDLVIERAESFVADANAHLGVAAAILIGKVSKRADDAKSFRTGASILLKVIRRERIRGAFPDKEDEQEAVEIAGALGMQEAIPALERRAWGIGRMFRDTCAWQAKIALARLRHSRAIDEIMRDLDSHEREVVSAAVVAAGRANLSEAAIKIERLTSASVDSSLVQDALKRLTAARHAR